MCGVHVGPQLQQSVQSNTLAKGIAKVAMYAKAKLGFERQGDKRASSRWLLYTQTDGTHGLWRAFDPELRPYLTSVTILSYLTLSCCLGCLWQACRVCVLGTCLLSL